MSITYCASQVLCRILHWSENSDTTLVSKQFCQRFDQALANLWNHFLKEEKITASSILQNIENRYGHLKYEISNTKACLPALRKFKAFFDSPSQEMIEQTLKCSSNSELCTLKTQYDHALSFAARCLINNYKISDKVEKLDPSFEIKSWRFRLTSLQEMAPITSEQGRHFFHLFRKNKTHTEDIQFLELHNPMFSTNYKIIPSEVFLTFDQSTCVVISHHFNSFPKEIVHLQNLQILRFNGTQAPTPRPELVNLKSLKVVRGVNREQIMPFVHHHYILTSLVGIFNNPPICFIVEYNPGEGNRLELRGEWYRGVEGAIILDQISWEKGYPLVRMRPQQWILHNWLAFSDIPYTNNCFDYKEYVDTDGYYFKFKVCKVTEQNELFWEKGDDRIWYASLLFGKFDTPMVFPEFD